MQRTELDASTGEVSVIDMTENQIAALMAQSPAVPDVISRRQFFQVLTKAPWNLISQAEALDAVRTGSIPPSMQAIIDALPEDHQFDATMLLSGATDFERSHPLTIEFAEAQDMTAAQVDDLWRAASAL